MGVGIETHSMKRITLLVLLLCCQQAFAQTAEISIPRTVFKVAPQNFAINSLKMSVERFNQSYTKSLSVSLNGQIYNEERSDEGFNVLGVELQGRTYLNPMATALNKVGRPVTQGLYLASYMQGARFSGQSSLMTFSDPARGINEYQTTEANGGNWGAGVTIGWQRVIWSRLFIDVFVGGGAQWSDIIFTTFGSSSISILRKSFQGDFTDVYYQGIMPKMGIHFGLGI